MTTITVIELARSPNSFEVTVKRPGQVYNGHYRHLRGVEAAAAMAVDLANNVRGSYTILAPKKVEDAIKNGGIKGYNP